MPDISDLRGSAASDADSFHPLAGLLAFLLPGAGHAFLGDPRRGLLVGSGVLLMFGSGLLIAGLDAVDSGLTVTGRVRQVVLRVTGQPPVRERSFDGDPIWFLGQLFVGPIALGVDYAHQYHFKVREPLPGQEFLLRSANPDEGRDPATGGPRPLAPGESPPYVKSLSRVQETGTLYCTIAGMMNLIAIIDASFGRRRRRPAATGAGGSPA